MELVARTDQTLLGDRGGVEPCAECCLGACLRHTATRRNGPQRDDPQRDDSQRDGPQRARLGCVVF